MDGDWIDGTLAPVLANVADRQWTAESLREFVNDLSHMISAAVRSGELSREGARQARERVGEAMTALAGGTANAAVGDFDPATVMPALEQRDE